MRWRLIVLAAGVLVSLVGTAWFSFVDPYGTPATVCLLGAVGGAAVAGACLGSYAYGAGYRNPRRRRHHRHWHRHWH